MNKHLKRLPPFCWTREYVKFGATNTLIGTAGSFLVSLACYLFTMSVWPFAFVISNYFGWIYRQKSLNHFRPCRDCPLRKGYK